MKRVGIILRIENIEGIDKHYVRDLLLKSISKYNVEVICIPITNNLNKIYNIINECDGIILPGGDDILQKDLEIIDYLYKNDIPTLGICLGMQEMAVFMNGTIIEDVSKNHYKKKKYTHDLIIDNSSKLFSILNNYIITINSYHHQIIKETDLFISGRSSDNTIEAVEDQNKTCFIGIQWHPEYFEDVNSNKLFNWFFSL